MAKDPAFLFYPNDWLGGTLGMTHEEKGAYLELLVLQFNRGHMTEDMIRHMVGDIWERIRNKFIHDDQGLWYNSRLEEEQTKRQQYVKSRNNNRKGKNQFSKNTPNNGHMTTYMENENENRNGKVKIADEDGSFQLFWDLYDKKIDRKTTEKKWYSIPVATREQIMNVIPSYIQSTPDKRYRKNPATYLNNSSWENEIFITQEKQISHDSDFDE